MVSVDDENYRIRQEQLIRLEKYRDGVKNHDLAMEALVRARNEFHEALDAAYKTAATIDAKVILVLDSYRDKEQMIFIKELRTIQHG